MFLYMDACEKPKAFSHTREDFVEAELLPSPGLSDTLCNSGGDGTAMSDALQSRQSCVSTLSSRNQFQSSKCQTKRRNSWRGFTFPQSLSLSLFYFYFLFFRRVVDLLLLLSPPLPPLFPTTASLPSSLQPSPVASLLSSHLVAMATSSSYQSTLSPMNILVQLSGFLPHHDLSVISAGRHTSPSLLSSLFCWTPHPFSSPLFSYFASCSLPFLLSSPVSPSFLFASSLLFPSLVSFFFICSLPSLGSLLFSPPLSFSFLLRHSSLSSFFSLLILSSNQQWLPSCTQSFSCHTFTHYYYYYSSHLLSLTLPLSLYFWSPNPATLCPVSYSLNYSSTSAISLHFKCLENLLLLIH